MESVPLLLAPAMNREMWAHPATQRNLAQVQADGAQVLGVGNGSQACGETGDGRMLEPEEIMEELAAHFTAKSLQGQHLLVTAGPTFEAIDPVRGITNLERQDGLCDCPCGARGRRPGHAGGRPVHLPTPRGVTRVDVQSARQMQTPCSPWWRGLDLHCHGRCCRLASGRVFRSEDQEGWLGRCAGHGLCREPRHSCRRGPVRPGPVRQAVLRGLCGRKP
jgi:phosphopantothenoylcysteine synthetase/decarboxylase